MKTLIYITYKSTDNNFLMKDDKNNSSLYHFHRLGEFLTLVFFMILDIIKIDGPGPNYTVIV